MDEALAFQKQAEDELRRCNKGSVLCPLLHDRQDTGPFKVDETEVEP